MEDPEHLNWEEKSNRIDNAPGIIYPYTYKSTSQERTTYVLEHTGGVNVGIGIRTDGGVNCLAKTNFSLHPIVGKQKKLLAKEGLALYELV